MFKNYISIT